MQLARKLEIVGGDRSPQQEPAPSPHSMYAPNYPTLAELFACRQGTIREWAANGAPQKRRKGYRIQEWIAWRRDRDATNSRRPEDESTAEADRRLKVANASRAEIRLQRDKDELVDSGEARLQRERIIRWFLAAFEQLGPELQTELAPSLGVKAARATRKAIEDYVRRLRKRSSEGG